MQDLHRDFTPYNARQAEILATLKQVVDGIHIPVVLRAGMRSGKTAMAIEATWGCKDFLVVAGPTERQAANYGYDTRKLVTVGAKSRLLYDSLCTGRIDRNAVYVIEEAFGGIVSFYLTP